MPSFALVRPFAVLHTLTLGSPSGSIATTQLCFGREFVVLLTQSIFDSTYFWTTKPTAFRKAFES